MQNSSMAGWGIALVVIGAVFRWAISEGLPGINLGVIGMILMLAGLAVFALAFVPRSKSTRRVITRATDHPDGPVQEHRSDY